MSEKKIIGIDCDEVLSETFKKILELSNNNIGGKILLYEDIVDSYLPNIEGVDGELAKKAFYASYINDAEKLELPVVQNAKETLENLKNLGYEIYIVTARDEKTFGEYTKKWLEKHFNGLYKNVVFASHYTEKHIEKSEICKELGITKFVEDNHLYCVDLSNAGIQTFLLNKPWNIQKDDENHKIIRCDNWEEIYNYLINF